MEPETDSDAGEPEPSAESGGGTGSMPIAPIEPFEPFAPGPPSSPPVPPSPYPAPYPTAQPSPAVGQLPPDVYGYPPYGYGYPSPNPQVAKGTNGMAIAALVLGICGFLFVTPIVGLVLGIISLAAVRRSGQRGKGMAISGIVLSSLWIALFATIIVVAGVTAQGPAKRNASGDVVTAGKVPIFDLHPKDCFTLPSGLIGSTDSKVRTLSVKPCSTPHDGEAIGTFTSSDGSYPGDGAMRAEGASQCVKLLSGYLVDSESMPHGSMVQYVIPNPQAWDQGERKVLCFMQFPATRTQLLHRDASSYTAEQLRFLNAFRPVSEAASQLNALSVEKSPPLTDLQQRASDISTSVQTEISTLTSAPWSADVQTHIDALVTMHQDSEQWWTKAAGASDQATFDSDVEQGGIALSLTDLNAARAALGLPQIAVNASSAS